MIRILIALALTCLVALPALAAAQATVTADAGAGTPAPQPSAAANAFVAPFARDHLSGMLSRIGARQPSMVALSQLQGQLVAAVFDAEIDRAVARHGAEWQGNLASVWGSLLPDEALISLAEDAAASPYVDAYRATAPQASIAMQELSGDLFAQILTEVIDATVAELSTPPAN